MSNLLLCNLAEVADPGALGIELDALDGPLSLFIIRRGQQVFAYRNKCPHTGIPLEWQPNQFLDLENNFIQCALHGALFTVEKGYCVRGPCAGQSLEPLVLTVADNGDIYLMNENCEQEAIN